MKTVFITKDGLTSIVNNDYAGARFVIRPMSGNAGMVGIYNPLAPSQNDATLVSRTYDFVEYIYDAAGHTIKYAVFKER